MSRDDDRFDDDPVTPGEQSRAEAFGRLVDGLLAGDSLPPAMDSEDRALVEAATVVMASSRAIEVPPERTRRLVDQALEAAILRKTGAKPAERAAPVMAAVPGDDPNERSVVTEVTVRRRRMDRAARILPWAVASLAAAAAIILFIARPPDRDRGGAQAELSVPLDVTHTSRPADPLFGAIAKSDRGKASERIDVLYADRMAGYRDLMFRRALPNEPETP
jgi:hypothetical protein